MNRRKNILTWTVLGRLEIIILILFFPILSAVPSVYKSKARSVSQNNYGQTVDFNHLLFFLDFCPCDDAS